MQEKKIIDLKNPIVWMDLQFTGLNFEKDQIIQIAVIMTDGELNKTVKGPNMAIKCPKKLLDNMDAWNTQHHSESGLLDRVHESDIDLDKAQQITLEFIKQYSNPNEAPLAGNSIHTDRAFLAKDMPELNNYLHYRIIDVTTIKQLCMRWNNSLFKERPKKKGAHLALDDILESIEELRFYKKKFFHLK